MIPITKNIVVVDEHGNEYEATYLKRAKGLVKNGRARFIDKNTICLACPPNKILEEKVMSNDVKYNVKVSNDGLNNNEPLQNEEVCIVIEKILTQIERLTSQTDYINSAIGALSAMSDGDSGEVYSPGNVQGKAKAKALGKVVRSREVTNRKTLKLLRNMYDDIKPKKESIYNKEDIMHLVHSLPPGMSKKFLKEMMRSM
ncbi:MAG: hypothetical protein LBD23_14405 [Oscillospiraceae bacterium]|jgi:hypothetical protein|nr:hypothetical protein [Oscillospiraceae bacterium]